MLKLRGGNWREVTLTIPGNSTPFYIYYCFVLFNMFCLIYWLQKCTNPSPFESKRKRAPNDSRMKMKLKLGLTQAETGPYANIVISLTLQHSIWVCLTLLSFLMLRHSILLAICKRILSESAIPSGKRNGQNKLRLKLKPSFKFRLRLKLALQPSYLSLF